mmetsp:Transcript_7497/g.24738  ORF Transcript_7497/g.24738 Transcript_7497/m.24738 type:complete len:338 (+) Transcript_7497:692-1705(+)
MKPLERTRLPRAFWSSAFPSTAAGCDSKASVTFAGMRLTTFSSRSGENGRRREYTKLSIPNRVRAVVAENPSSWAWECECDECDDECDDEASSWASCSSCEWVEVSFFVSSSAAWAWPWAWEPHELQEDSSTFVSSSACEWEWAEWEWAADEWASSSCLPRVVVVVASFTASTAMRCSSTGPCAAAPRALAAPRTAARGASPLTQDCTVACVLMEVTTASSRSRSSGRTRSALFRRTTSAHSTCSRRRSTTERRRAPPNWAMTNETASSSEAARSGRREMGAVSEYSARKPAESTTVTMVSRAISSMRGSCSKAASWKESRTARGSATPVASTTMWS